MAEYRWNTNEFARGYDAAAEAFHPHYREIQDNLLASLPAHLRDDGLLVDLGGGSGKLIERFLDQHPRATGVVVDQSEPFLALAERRLARFGARALCTKSRLQDDWPQRLPGQPWAIVSMSAIHHLEPREKEQLYRRCFEVLLPGGILQNGDEVRPEDDALYRPELEAWAAHMRHGMADGSINPLMHPALDAWIDRNLTHFGEARKSGDDCHETISAQLEYLRQAGFARVDCPWLYGMWALLQGVKPAAP
ncbi:MAG: methyltransferase [Pirellulaceae bacterium]